MKITLVIKKRIENAHWVCSKCGNKYGKHRCGTATWHTGTCGVCGKTDAVTEFRDFGYSIYDKSKHYEL